MRRLLSAAVCAVVLAAVCGGLAAPAGARGARRPARCPWLDARLPVARRVALLRARMTLAEMLTLMNGRNGARGGVEGETPAIPALCIPQVEQEDGPAGVAFGQSGVTQLPSPIDDAATWDPAQARAYGRVLGAEEWAKGISVVYAPTINIDRDPRWGRNFESLSEDPLLTGTLAAAEVRGIQSQGPIAEVKHYAVYDVETNRDTPLDDDVIGERTLHEIYLPAFHDAVIGGGARAVMCSYSSPDGTYACQNRALLAILERDWGFRGFVGSDYGATHSAIASADAGLDQEQAGSWYGTPLTEAIADGQVSITTIDDAVDRILWAMFSAGLFDHQPPAAAADVSTPAHVAFAREDAERGAVLLKDADSVLPLGARTGSIAVIGPDCTTNPITAGGGSAYVRPGPIVTPLAGIAAAAARRGVSVRSYAGESPAVAAALARSARVAVVCASEWEREGADLQSIALPGAQDQLIAAVASANPRTVVVLNTGGPVMMPWLSGVRGVLEAWYPGQQDGAALASLLFGQTDPSGHLTETFPRSLSQIPTRAPARFPGADGHVEYSDGLEVGYRYYDTARVTPLFPFGFGESYTRFAFSRLALSPRRVVVGRAGRVLLRVSALVRNVGRRGGAAVAQLYLGDPRSMGEPARQLEGFARVALAPGQSRRVTFTLRAGAVSSWSDRAGGWVIGRGRFAVYVGESSGLGGLPLRASFTVTRRGARREKPPRR